MKKMLITLTMLTLIAVNCSHAMNKEKAREKKAMALKNAWRSLRDKQFTKFYRLRVDNLVKKVEIVAYDDKKREIRENSFVDKITLVYREEGDEKRVLLNIQYEGEMYRFKMVEGKKIDRPFQKILPLVVERLGDKTMLDGVKDDHLKKIIKILRQDILNFLNRNK